MADQRSLVQKMAEIMKAVGNVPKTGFNKFHNYSYVKEEDILNALREQMADKNLMIFQNLVDKEVEKSGTEQKPKYLTTIKIEYTIHDGDSGESITISSGGQGEDSGDKGIYKAITGANKYALMKLFMISTGDDPENDGSRPNQPGDNNQNGNGRNNQNGNRNNQRASGPPPNINNNMDAQLKPLYQKLFGSLDNYEGFMLKSNLSDEAVLKWLQERLKEKPVYLKKINTLLTEAGWDSEKVGTWVKKGLHSGYSFTGMLKSLEEEKAKKSAANGSR